MGVTLAIEVYLRKYALVVIFMEAPLALSSGRDDEHVGGSFSTSTFGATS